MVPLNVKLATYANLLKVAAQIQKGGSGDSGLGSIRADIEAVVRDSPWNTHLHGAKVDNAKLNLRNPSHACFANKSVKEICTQKTAMTAQLARDLNIDNLLVAAVVQCLKNDVGL